MRERAAQDGARWALDVHIAVRELGVRAQDDVVRLSDRCCNLRTISISSPGLRTDVPKADT